MCEIMFINIVLTLFFSVLLANNATAQWHCADEWEPHNAAITTHTLPFNFKNPPVCRKPLHRNDPCSPHDPPTRNFSAPGRRVSEAKCYEYIWQMKARHDREERSTNCRRKRHIVGITYGEPTERGEHPNMGAIGWKLLTGEWTFMCGSTLISPKFVLTAAHCSAASKKDTRFADVVPKIVRFGTRNLIKQDTANALDVNIKKIIVHPNYKAPRQYFDIALMQLAKNVYFSADVQPSCLWTNRDITFSSRLQIAGWGFTHEKSRETSPVLLKGEVDIIDSITCNYLLGKMCNRNFCGLEDHQICAGNLSGGVDTCRGDSGGPLQVQLDLPIVDQGNINYVIGITSFGKSCGAKDQPGVYTRVFNFLDWIEDIVWPGK
ncbi:serine protease snake [Helicoverpa armigera]|uniref:serine protease snake n=1 Tax=Helicoverpa armigera TaxID=29058 RepID=UPI003082D21A